MSELDRAAAVAIDKHERLLHHKTLELLLGSMDAPTLLSLRARGLRFRV